MQTDNSGSGSRHSDVFDELLRRGGDRRIIAGLRAAGQRRRFAGAGSDTESYSSEMTRIALD